MINGLYENHIRVADLDRSRRFYDGQLGLEVGWIDESKRRLLYWVGKPGKAMLGIDVKLDAFPWFWSDQFDSNVQLLGDLGVYDEALPLAVLTPGPVLTLYRESGAIVGVVGINAGREIRAIKRALETGQPLPQSILATARVPQAIGA